MGKSTFEMLYAYNEDLATKGAPMVVGLNAKGDEIKFFIAKWANEKHEKEMLRRQKQLQASRYSKTRNTRIQCEMFADTILIGWENVLDTDGNDHPATRENKLAALIKFKDLRDQILEFSMDNMNYLAQDENPEAEDDTEKN